MVEYVYNRNKITNYRECKIRTQTKGRDSLLLQDNSSATSNRSWSDPILFVISNTFYNYYEIPIHIQFFLWKAFYKYLQIVPVY